MESMEEIKTKLREQILAELEAEKVQKRIKAIAERKKKYYQEKKEIIKAYRSEAHARNKDVENIKCRIYYYRKIGNHEKLMELEEELIELLEAKSAVVPA
jgi:DNA repair exonuclease SbcCD ATPase subunit